MSEHFKGFWIEVYGNNARFHKRLHGAGFTFSAHTRRWVRLSLSSDQAKSLVGRLRNAGLKAMLHGHDAATARALNVAHDRPYVPTKHDTEYARREEAARVAVNRSLAKRKKRSRHRGDNARKSYETTATGRDTTSTL